MKEQLSKILQIFYVIPMAVSFLTFFLLLLVIPVYVVRAGLGAIPAVLLFVISLTFLLGKIVADGKIKKFRNGANPLYLVKKHPEKLDEQIADLVEQKYILKDKTTTTARLERKPYFSFITALFLFLVGVLPGVLYIFWYISQPNEIVLLDIKTQKNLGEL